MMFAFISLLAPTYTFSAERKGTVLLFSFGDLKKELIGVSALFFKNHTKYDPEEIVLTLYIDKTGGPHGL